MGNIIYCFQCFDGNLADFSAVKEFWKLVKIWRNYRHKSVTRFLRHV